MSICINVHSLMIFQKINVTFKNVVVKILFNNHHSTPDSVEVNINIKNVKIYPQYRYHTKRRNQEKSPQPWV